MRKLAIAQLGSDTIDQRAFATIVVEQTIRQIVPIALRAAAAHIPEHAERLEAVALRCENDGNSAAANAARSAANEADRFTAYPAAYPAAYAAYAAAAYASDAAAEPAAYPAAAGAVAVADAVAARDNVLMICADIGLSALIELKSPGCRYLWLTENKE